MTTSEQRVLTPTLRRSFRRSLFWIAAAVFGLLIAVIAFAQLGAQSQGAPLDPSDASPVGSKALAEVLRQQGVQLTATTTLAETERAIGDPDSTTLLIYDPSSYLNDEQLREAAGLSGRVLIASAGFDQLRSLAPELALAGVVDGTLTGDCDLPPVQRAQTVSGGGTGYRVIDDSAALTACLGSGDGVYSLIQLDRGSGTLTVLGATDALSNQSIIGEGNAAFALGLLGHSQHLVWYLPSFADVAGTGPETLGELSPAWVMPVMLLLLLAVVAAAVWRGRRLGPLVIENLPVTVRASETMLGRARLYERSSSRLRALDALRLGTLQRLAGLCGLPRAASLDEVLAAVAGAIGAQPGEIRRLLVDAQPSSDRELLALSDALLVLERRVAEAVRP